MSTAAAAAWAWMTAGEARGNGGSCCWVVRGEVAC